jgi:glucose/mannose-6-phosphate isomerase
VPVVYGAGPTASVAARWKTQVNENAMAPAFAATLPEADHNDICGWERAASLAPLAAVLLDDQETHPAVRRRISLTAEVVRRNGATAEVVESRGETRVERVLSLVLLGDLVSVYMAALAGVDPTPVAVLDQLKRDLAEAPSA